MQRPARTRSFEESRRASKSTQFVHTGVRAPIGILAILAVASAIAAAPAASLFAQGSTPATFEVVSIRPQTAPRPPRGVSAPDRFTDADTTLRDLIEYAYDLTPAQVVGGPEWIASSRFAVDAKAAGTPSRAEMRGLVRALLADRFNLKAHTETRQLPVYLLERVQPNGPLARALTATPTSECAGPVATLAQAPPTEPGEKPSCGILSATPVSVTARGVSMSQFARNIRAMGGMTGIDRIVIDRTGLAGYYTFELKYRPAETAQITGGDNNPTLFDAVREQLGLKLTPTRTAVSVLVVDSAALPAAD
jgi:uncharacterized protein (TIGR03435 family)